MSPFLEPRGYREGLELGSEHGIAPSIDDGRRSEVQPANIGLTTTLDKSVGTKVEMDGKRRSLKSPKLGVRATRVAEDFA